MEIRTPEDILGGQPQLPDLRRYAPLLVGALLVGSFVMTLFYSVPADSVGVVQRFGQFINNTPPGLHMKIPFGVDRVTKVPVQAVITDEFGFRTLRAGVQTQYSSKQYFDESLMLTGDLNIAVVDWTVQWRIKDPEKYLFQVRNPRGTLRDVMESAMRQSVGDRTINEVITEGRAEIAEEVQARTQVLLDEYQTGISIVTSGVRLQDVNPPDEVKPAFNEVNQAKQERERLINQAWENYNRIIPRARGEAQQTIRGAEGYALDRVNRAKGDAERFLLQWQEYAKAPDVTRQRLYLEALERSLSQVKSKYIMEPSSQTPILPLLQLQSEGDVR